MKKLIFAVLIGTSFGVNELNGQDYIDAMGFRAGSSFGLTYKHFFNEKAALEALITSRWLGFGITGLYEIHANAIQTAGLNWYYGVGAHTGHYPGKATVLTGIDGVIGIEYNLKDFPLNFSFDWKPSINIFGYSIPWFNDVAVSIRYRFN